MKRLFVYVSFLLAVGMLLFNTGSRALHAQQKEAGTITGTVMDPVGSAVQGATVVARNNSSGAETRATTDQEGKFSISNLPFGNYTVEVSAPGFAVSTRPAVKVSAERTEDVAVTLALGDISDAITVEANASGSIAAQHAPMDGLLEARSARTEISPMLVQNFTSPMADFGELVEMAPGTFSINSNGIGLGQDKTYFRGFPDGDYDIDYDGVPFYDTNTPTHHTWAFFPDPWTGSVDFDRSPGTASSIGPTPFGGSIHLLSPDMTAQPTFAGGVSYGSFNTELYDLNVDSGAFLGKKSNLLVDVQHMQSKGFETNNFQTHNAGMLKFVHKFSEGNVLTGYSGVEWLDSNTPNNPPERGQIQGLGYNFLLTNDTNAAELTNGACSASNPNLYTQCLYPENYHFYTYHVPTDFEYVDWSKQWGHGWQTDFKPYTLSYYNAQYYNNSFTFVGQASPTTVPSAVDKLNSYRKYGDEITASQVSKYGILRVGVWYEWAKTNRYQIPSNPLDHVDDILPNFHERFNTNSLQPFIEYEYRMTSKLTVTAGFKYSYFNQNLTQYQDNGKTVGCLGGVLTGGKTGTCVGGVPSVNHSAGYNSYLPSVDANYHLANNWSAYAEFGMGTIVPPSSVFDVTGASVAVTPKPTGVSTYQIGSVLKFKRATLNADAYYIRFQGTYTAIPDVNIATAAQYVTSGNQSSKGVELEGNLYIGAGLSLYGNATMGVARYISGLIPNLSDVLVANPNFGKWVANTPSNTEAIGLTYNQKYLEIGMFEKRVGPMYNDLSVASSVVFSGVANQVIPIAPFNVTNFYFNYTVRKGSKFAQSKIRLSVNNIFNYEGIVGDQQAYVAKAVYQTGPADLLTLLPGRSITLTLTPVFTPRGQ